MEAHGLIFSLDSRCLLLHFFGQLHIKVISNVLYFSKSAECASIKNITIVLFNIDKREYQLLYCLWFRLSFE